MKNTPWLRYLSNLIKIILGQSVNTCTYVHRYNILMAFVNGKKKVETMIKENSQSFIDKWNKKMLFGPKFEETVAKSLLSKSKSNQF